MKPFLPNVIRLFSYYKDLGEKAMAQIDATRIHEVPAEDMNSLAIIVKHLHGNMLSRWTDFLNTDGEKEWRNRDGEFENADWSYDEMMGRWQQGWQLLLDTLHALREDQLQHIIYIRKEGHTVLDAILRQLAHYSYHVGQVIWVCQYYKKDSWQSLSIPKGGSEAFNAKKQQADKTIRHFTEK